MGFPMSSRNPTYIIAEAGVNHNGSLDRAMQMIEVAVEAGADAVKFQCFVPELLVTNDTPQAAYQRRNLHTQNGRKTSQLDMLRELTLSNAEHQQLVTYCSQNGIEYMSSPFDMPSLRFLCNDINLPRIKFGSGEITNGPLLLEAAEQEKDIILSTGMSNLQEVQTALGVLAFGYTRDRYEQASMNAFQNAFGSEQGQQALRHHVTLLHCTSAYPCPYGEINLRAMDTLAGKFAMAVGLSDHSAGIEIPIAAVARGACMIEKHFTLDKNLPGPDHKASLEPDELNRMVQAIRHIEMALGTGDKNPTDSELDTKLVARKQLVAAKPIKAGELFSEANLTAKRATEGISPMHYWEILGQAARKDYQPDEVIVP
jgi:N-acetylneuraminate synthase